jgi:hypothetical protein
MSDNEQEYENISSFSGKYLLTIFAVTILVRILCMIILQSWNFYDQWQFGWEIGKLGNSLASGLGISIDNTPIAKFPPVYPLIVGGVFAIFGIYSTASAIILFLLQSVFSAFIAVFLIILGNRFFGPKEGIIAGLVWAFYPTSILYSVKFIWYSEFVVMIILLMIIIATGPKPFSLFSKIACLGGLTGLIVMTDSTMAVYPTLLLFWMLFASKLTLKKWIFSGIVWFIAFGICVTPWAIRNYLVLGTPGILKSNFGLELFFGNNPYSTGGGIDKERYQALDSLDREEYDYYVNLSEHAYYGYLQTQAIEWIQENPLKFVQLSAKRFWFYWGKFPSSGPGPLNKHTWKILVWYVPIALLALYGIWYCIKRGWNLVPVCLFLLVYPLPFYITHVQLHRYRYPVEVFLVLLAAVPLTICFTYCWNRFVK